jgi:hypothetical protein
MKYNTMIKYFETPNGLVDLINDYKTIFDMIDEIGQALLQGIISTTVQYKEVLNQFTGAYIGLEPLSSLAEAHKLNEELRYYVEKKRELESKGEKVVAATLEKESSQAVAEFRRIRNILEGYVLACEKGIVTCQTQIKRFQDDEKYKPVEEQK